MLADRYPLRTVSGPCSWTQASYSRLSSWFQRNSFPLRRNYLSSHRVYITELEVGWEKLKEEFDSFKASKRFSEIRSESINRKPPSCPAPGDHVLFDTIDSSQRIHKSRNTAEHFDAKPLPYLWDVILFLFQLKVVNLVRYTPPLRNILQHFIHFSLILYTICIVRMQASFSMLYY